MNPAPPVIRICIEHVSSFPPILVSGLLAEIALTPNVSSKGGSNRPASAHQPAAQHGHMPTRAYRDMTSLSKSRINLIASRARALGDPTRVRILGVLARGEQPVGHIAAALSTKHSTVSKHLQVLFQAGFVQRRRDASVVRYWLTSGELLRWCRYLAAARLEARSRARRGTA